jgi:hypothetical protein
LADTERDGHRVSFNLAFEAEGMREVWDEDRYGKLLEVGGGKERMTAHWVSEFVCDVLVCAGVCCAVLCCAVLCCAALRCFLDITSWP